MTRETIESYLSLAQEDLRAAAMLSKPVPRSAAFHLAQAAEKLIKAVLTVEGIAFSTRHHQLGALAELLPGEHPWRPDLMAFDRFTSYATALRYPTPGGRLPAPPEPVELARDRAELDGLAAEIRDWCAEALSEK